LVRWVHAGKKHIPSELALKLAERLEYDRWAILAFDGSKHKPTTTLAM
jgi:hypothetical protein